MRKNAIFGGYDNLADGADLVCIVMQKITLIVFSTLAFAFYIWTGNSAFWIEREAIMLQHSPAEHFTRFPGGDSATLECVFWNIFFGFILSVSLWLTVWFLKPSIK